MNCKQELTMINNIKHKYMVLRWCSNVLSCLNMFKRFYKGIHVSHIYRKATRFSTLATYKGRLTVVTWFGHKRPGQQGQYGQGPYVHQFHIFVVTNVVVFCFNIKIFCHQQSFTGNLYGSYWIMTEAWRICKPAYSLHCAGHRMYSR